MDFRHFIFGIQTLVAPCVLADRSRLMIAPCISALHLNPSPVKAGLDAPFGFLLTRAPCIGWQGHGRRGGMVDATDLKSDFAVLLFVATRCFSIG
jgi:hypothetical protein